MSDLVKKLRKIAVSTTEKYKSEGASLDNSYLTHAADLIEQLQAQIAELEKSERTAWSTLIATADKLGIDIEEARKRKDGKPSDVFVEHFNMVCNENNELAATVDDYRNRYERKDLVWFERCEVGGLAPEQVGFIDLNEMKREVAKEAFLKGAEWWAQCELDDTLYLDENQAAFIYANSIYPSDKGGE